MMRSAHPALLPMLALSAFLPVLAQEGAAVSPPSAEGAALAEQVAAMQAERVQQSHAIKAVWLERLIRAREERHRVTRENLAYCTLLAKKLGAPEAFVVSLRQQSIGNLPPRERHALESALQELLEAYGVNAKEIRFFVEGSGLTPEQLREVAAWLPLAGVFNTPPAVGEELTADSLAPAAKELLSALPSAASVLAGVVDEASADAAAELLLPSLAHQHAALALLFSAPDALRAEVLAPLAAELDRAQAACTRERARVAEQGWFGSIRLQAVDYLLH